MIAPLSSGYCLIQTIVMMVVVWSVAFANIGWSSTVDYLTGNGIPLMAPTLTAAESAVPGLGQIMLCRTMVNMHEAANQAMSTSGYQQQPVQLTSGSGISAVGDSKVNATEVWLQFGNPKLAVASNWSNLGASGAAAICGKVTVSANDTTAADGGSGLDVATTAAGRSGANLSAMTSKMNVAVANAALLAVEDVLTWDGVSAPVTGNPPIAGLPSDALNNSVLGRIATAAYLRSTVAMTPGDAYDKALGWDDARRTGFLNTMQSNDIAGYYANINAFYAASLQNRMGTAIASVFKTNQALADMTAMMKAEGWSSAGNYARFIEALNSTILAAMKNAKVTVSTPDMSAIAKALDGQQGPFLMAATVKNYTSMMGDLPSLVVTDVDPTTGKVTGVSCSMSAAHPSEAVECAQKYANGEIMTQTIMKKIGYTGLFSSMALKSTTGVSENSAEVGTLMSSITSTGHVLLLSWDLYMGLVATLSAFTAVTGFLSGPTMTVLTNLIATPLSIVVLACVVCGVTLAYVLPMMPSLAFDFGFIGWVILSLEMVIAAPLWALSHLKLGGDGFIGSASREGYHILLQIFFRPFLMLLGYIMGLALFEVLGRFLINGLVVSFGVNTASTGWGESWSLWKMMAFFVILTMIISNLTERCFHLCLSLPDKVLRMMDAGGQSHDESHASNVRNAVMGFVSRTGGGMSNARFSTAKPKPKPPGAGNGGEGGGVEETKEGNNN